VRGFVRARRAIAALVVAGAPALVLAPGAADAGGVTTNACGLAHHGDHRWTVETILSTTEDSHPDVSCATARATVAAIDGGKAVADRREQSPASGESELVYGKWVCTITNGWHGGGDSTFMARRVHGQPTWVSCSDGVDVNGNDDSIGYSYGKVSLL
jgi:hypothetical protein